MKAVYFLYLNLRHGYRGLCRYNLSGHFNVPYGNYKKLHFLKTKYVLLQKVQTRNVYSLRASYDETPAMLRAGMWFIASRHMTGTFSGYHAAGFTTPRLHLASILNAGHQKLSSDYVSNSDTSLTRSLS